VVCAGIRTRSGGQKNIEQAFFGVEFGFIGYVFETLLANHFDGDLDQVANHGFDIAAHVTDFCELRGFDFEKRRVGQLGEAAGDFGFADAGGADHDDVLGDDFFRHLGPKFLAAHAIAQGDGDGALGVFLSDNVFVELGDDFARRQFVERDLLFFGGSG